MWHFQIITENNECLESGVCTNEKMLIEYCNKEMKKLKAYNWIAEYMDE